VCETLSFSLREEHRTRVFENRVIRGRDLRRKWREAEEDFIRRSFITSTFHHMLLG
jgi:hypothetical protein